MTDKSAVIEQLENDITHLYNTTVEQKERIDRLVEENIMQSNELDETVGLVVKIRDILFNIQNRLYVQKFGSDPQTTLHDIEIDINRLVTEVERWF